MTLAGAHEQGTRKSVWHRGGAWGALNAEGRAEHDSRDRPTASPHHNTPGHRRRQCLVHAFPTCPPSERPYPQAARLITGTGTTTCIPWGALTTRATPIYLTSLWRRRC